MISRGFFRLKPLGITVGSVDSARGFGVTGVTDSTGVTYNNFALPWPGLWTIAAVGGAGGGGGYSSSFFRNGAAGSPAALVTPTVTLGRRPITVKVGAGGAAGANGASASAGSTGNSSSVSGDGTNIASGGFGGAAGASGTTHNPTPAASNWPYGSTTAGQGGRGGTDTLTPLAGQAGAVRLKLVG